MIEGKILSIISIIQILLNLASISFGSILLSREGNFLAILKCLNISYGYVIFLIVIILVTIDEVGCLLHNIYQNYKKCEGLIKRNSHSKNDESHSNDNNPNNITKSGNFLYDLIIPLIGMGFILVSKELEKHITLSNNTDTLLWIIFNMLSRINRALSYLITTTKRTFIFFCCIVPMLALTIMSPLLYSLSYTNVASLSTCGGLANITLSNACGFEALYISCCDFYYSQGTFYNQTCFNFPANISNGDILVNNCSIQLCLLETFIT
jgi:hypothetical protein